MRRSWIAPIILGVFALSSCGKFIGNLRRDLDDSDPVYNRDMVSGPTSGGTFAERGFLGPDMPDAGPGSGDPVSVNHVERNPSSEGSRPLGPTPWLSNDQQEANRRDRYRAPESVAAQDPSGLSSANTANVSPPVQREYKNGNRATRADFVDESQNEGSLWASDGQTNYYFTKNKIRGVGDIITLTIENELYKDIGIEAKRTLSPEERKKEVSLVQDKFRKKFLADMDSGKASDTLASSASAPAPTPNLTRAPAGAGAGTPAALGSAAAPVTPSPTPSPSSTPLTDQEVDALVPKANIGDVDIYPSLEIKAGETMMGEIIERYPNGNYKVRAVKKVNYAHGTPRLVTLVGIVKSTDISEDDVIASGKLYEYRVETIHQ